MAQPTKQLYPGLDMIRFSAAIMVTLYHLTYHGWRLGAADDRFFSEGFTRIAPFFTCGYVGVPVFFVLSGFVIAFSATGKTASRFLQSRVLRLYPAVWICATLTALTILGEPSFWERYLHSLDSVSGGPVGRRRLLDARGRDHILWSRRARAGWLWRQSDNDARICSRDGQRRLLAHALRGFPGWIALSDPFSGLESQVGNLLVHGLYFALGIMLWSITEKGLSRAKLVMTGVCLIAGVIAMTAAARYEFTDAGGPRRDLIVVPLLWVLAVCAMAASARWNGPLSGRLAKQRRIIRTVGLATYPLYLVHEVVGLKMMSSLGPVVGARMALLVSLGFVLSFAFGTVYLEKFPRMLLSSMISRAFAARRPRLRLRRRSTMTRPEIAAGRNRPWRRAK